MALLMKSLNDSFLLLLKKPKLFLPKILLAIIWGIQMLWMASITNRLIPVINDQVLLASIVPGLFAEMIFLIIYFLIALIIDTFVNGMYSSLVDDFVKKKEIAIVPAFFSSLKKANVLLPAVFISIIITTAIIALPTFLFDFFLLSNNLIGMILTGAILIVLTFGLIVLFYLMYPVAVIDGKGMGELVRSAKKQCTKYFPKKNNWFFDNALLLIIFLFLFFKEIAQVFFSSISLAGKNIGKISFASLVQFLISLGSVILAFFSSNPAFFALFWVGRLIVVLMATYSIVLNPMVYEHLEKKSQN